MDIQKLRQEFEKLPYIKGILYRSEFGFNESLNEYCHPDHTNHRLNYAFIMGAWMAWQAAQAVPDTQALHDRLLVKSIREHVESHISEVSVNDLFDKGWITAMKCVQNNIDCLKHRIQPMTEGFVLVERSKLLQILGSAVAINTNPKTKINLLESDFIIGELKAMIEAQEPAND